MYGAIIGDIVGSIYEFRNIKTKDFPWLTDKNHFTDDTIMTIAVADAILKCDQNNAIKDIALFKDELCSSMHRWGRAYWTAGYGQKFIWWLMRKSKEPYNSCGNGSAMRVSPTAWYCKTLDETLRLARASSEVTHNHIEGIKGAEAVAGAIFLAKNGSTKDEIKKFTSQYYDITFTLDDIRPTYRHVESCQESVPQAIEAFFESTDFEDAIRCAISIGGDSDTIAAITGSIAEAYYGIPDAIKNQIASYIDESMLDVVEKFENKHNGVIKVAVEC